MLAHANVSGNSENPLIEQRLSVRASVSKDAQDNSSQNSSRIAFLKKKIPL